MHVEEKEEGTGGGDLLDDQFESKNFTCKQKRMNLSVIENLLCTYVCIFNLAM